MAGIVQSGINQLLHIAGAYSAVYKKQKEKAQQAQLKQMGSNVTPKQANAMMAQKGQTQIAQRRNFADYLKKLPTSLGGTIGDLSPDLQKKIASQYSKSERRKLMDDMDRGSK